jgi:hypothetical protein
MIYKEKRNKNTMSIKVTNQNIGELREKHCFFRYPYSYVDIRDIPVNTVCAGDDEMETLDNCLTSINRECIFTISRSEKMISGLYMNYSNFHEIADIFRGCSIVDQISIDAEDQKYIEIFRELHNVTNLSINITKLHMDCRVFQSHKFIRFVVYSEKPLDKIAVKFRAIAATLDFDRRLRDDPISHLWWTKPKPKV